MTWAINFNLNPSKSPKDSRSFQGVGNIWCANTKITFHLHGPVLPHLNLFQHLLSLFSTQANKTTASLWPPAHNINKVSLQKELKKVELMKRQVSPLKWRCDPADLHRWSSPTPLHAWRELWSRQPRRKSSDPRRSPDHTTDIFYVTFVVKQSD